MDSNRNIKRLELDKHELDEVLKTFSAKSRIYHFAIPLMLLGIATFLAYSIYTFGFDLLMLTIGLVIATFVGLGAIRDLHYDLKKLRCDIKNGIKLEAKSTILSCSEFKNRVRLKDGFRIDFSDLEGVHWTVGQEINY